MAVDRLPSLTPPPAPQPARDLRALQQAFFQAALGQAQAAQPAPHVRAASPAQPPAQAATADPARPLRPGSIIDIKV